MFFLGDSITEGLPCFWLVNVKTGWLKSGQAVWHSEYENCGWTSGCIDSFGCKCLMNATANFGLGGDKIFDLEWR